jgi:hypothetical protein
MDNSSTHLNNLVHVAQDGAITVHTLARLPWLKKALFSGPLGRFLVPKTADGSQLGDVLKVRNIRGPHCIADNILSFEMVSSKMNSTPGMRIVNPANDY